MTFIGSCWWAILAIAGAIVYTWHAVLRASRSAKLAGAGAADTQDTALALRLYLPGFFGRPWVQRAYVQTAQERVRVLLERRRGRN